MQQSTLKGVAVVVIKNKGNCNIFLYVLQQINNSFLHIKLAIFAAELSEGT
jgi:hypothetical protein